MRRLVRRIGKNQQGVTGLETASLMCALFSIMNRMIDAFGADIPRELVSRSGLFLDITGKVMSRRSRKGDPVPHAGELPPHAAALLRSIRDGDGDAPADCAACKMRHQPIEAALVKLPRIVIKLALVELGDQSLHRR